MTTTWTSAAVATLEQHLKRSRTRIAASGADSDEVVSDLRRHVEEEIAALRLPVVTEQDVQQILRRIEPPEPEEQPKPAADPQTFWKTTWKHVGSGALLFFGVLLPAFTLGFELYTHWCAGTFFDPLPTWLHVLLVAVVPLANLAAWVNSTHWPERARRAVWIASGAAFGISLFYTGLFAPMMPFAAIGILFVGMGLLPLSPLFAFICTWRLRVRQRRKQWDQGAELFNGYWTAATAALLLLVLFAVPAPLTRHWLVAAGSDSADEVTRAIQKLRRWGSEDVLLRECYGRQNRILVDIYGWQGSNPELARKVFYRVTGKPFNSVPPPLSKYQRAGQDIFNEFEFDTALGGDAVAGQVKGLSLRQSRLDGLCNADEGWAYVEWILEFQNEHTADREVRAQIELPPGGVVSRLTLWVNGEEREAAFAGRNEVRAAYQQVAIHQRRDPVLVTMSGPDRVLMQCFPVPRGGGTIKVRLGITAPLVLENTNTAALRLPCFAERNFKIAKSFEHNVWLEGRQLARTEIKTLSTGTGDAGRAGVRGTLRESDLSAGGAVLRFERSTSTAAVRALDTRSPERSVVRQTIESIAPQLPSRCAIVIDGSADMESSFGEIARALNGFPSQPELSIWFAKDGVQNVFSSTWARRDTASAAVSGLRAAGGQDDVPALLQAWEWASAKSNSVVIWVHGAQPLILEHLEALKQRVDWRSGADAPTIIDVAARPGPNLIAEQLATSPVLAGLPRVSTLSDDLDRLFGSWSGRRPAHQFARTTEPSIIAAGFSAEPSASLHVVRLWAFDEIKKKVRARMKSDAINMAHVYQLVTPVSGAVVLETQQQFAAAGLTPVDTASVPVVPEPSVILLALLGLVALFLFRKRARKRVTAKA
jgi:hypothetical protein